MDLLVFLELPVVLVELAECFRLLRVRRRIRRGGRLALDRDRILRTVRAGVEGQGAEADRERQEQRDRRGVQESDGSARSRISLGRLDTSAAVSLL